LDSGAVAERRPNLGFRSPAGSPLCRRFNQIQVGDIYFEERYSEIKDLYKLNILADSIDENEIAVF